MMRQQMPVGLPDEPERPAGQHEHGLRCVPLGAAVAVGIACVQLLFVFSLGYPPLHAAPHEVPVGIAGPAPVVAQAEGQLSGQGDAYDLHPYADQAAARAAIEEREVYGAIVVTPSGPRLLVASAASPVIAGALRAQALRLGGGRPVPVTDVVPASPADPNGTGSLTTLLPLVLISLALGIAVALVERRRFLRLGWVALASATAGLGVAWIAHAMATFGGSYWGIAAVLGLLVFGIGAVSAGLTQIAAVGRGLAALLALLMLNIGIPGAGALVPAELLAQPWRAIGPYLPPGAAVNAMRGAGFFPGAATGAPLLLLATWAVAGLILVALPTTGRAARARS
ncbi:MAG TPA: hypothetical protein VF933_23150 [Streptosporangiaceae bacterium]